MEVHGADPIPLEPPSLAIAVAPLYKHLTDLNSELALPDEADDIQLEEMEVNLLEEPGAEADLVADNQTGNVTRRSETAALPQPRGFWLFVRWIMALRHNLTDATPDGPRRI